MNAVPPRRVGNRWHARVGLPTALLTSLSLLLPVLPAYADPAAATDPFSKTTTGAFNGTVPDGTCAVQIDALGASGGHNLTGGGKSAEDANGAGARVVATYKVIPGMTYAGTVGGGGAQAKTGGTNGGGAGGTNTNKNTHEGSGGGGYTVVTFAGQDLVVAGGGGGSGGGHSLNGGFGGNAGQPTGTGVAAGVNGRNGRNGPTNAANPGIPTGGQGGQSGAPGTGGVGTQASYSGSAGSARNGGAGGTDTTPDTGGGGGGGYYGAGGGASSVDNGEGVPITNGPTGAGGGGGASYVRPTSSDGSNAAPTGISSGLNATRDSGGPGADGSVKLTWIPCQYDLAVTKAAVVRDGSLLNPRVDTYTITVVNNGPDPMSRNDLPTIKDTSTGTASGAIQNLTARVSGGTNPTNLTNPTVTCTLPGNTLPGTFDCKRPYGSTTAGASTAGGSRGLNVGETLTLTFERSIAGGIGSNQNDPGTNQILVVDRTNGDTNDTAGAAVKTTPPVPPRLTADTSTGSQGAPQSAAVLANDSAGSGTFTPSTLTLLNPAGDPVTTLTVPGQGTYSIDRTNAAAPRIVFTPLPDFAGTPTPVDYRVANSNNATARSSYQPTVTPVTAPDTTIGPQGQLQTANVLANDTRTAGVTLTPASLRLVNAAGNPVTTLTVPGEGTYTVVNGQIQFQPLPTFSGTATPVTYTANDANGNAVRSTYTPTVESTNPNSEATESTGTQGAVQRVSPLDSVSPGDSRVPIVPSTLTLLNAAGDPVTSLTVPNQGTYTIDRTDPANPQIVFTPLPTFTGTATPVDYRVADVNGTTTSTNYNPVVTGVTRPDTSTGPQGVPQTKDVLANDTLAAGVTLNPATLQFVNAAGARVDTLTVAGQGTYTVVNGQVRFTPLATFTGTATPVTYIVNDSNGNAVTDTYTPTVTPVRPTAENDNSSGPQGRPQTVDPLANDTPGDPAVPLDPTSLTLLNAAGNPVATLTIPSQGTYSIDRSNPAVPLLVFTPLATYSGTPTPAAYRVADANGVTARATYQPRVTEVAPTAAPDTSTGPQGAKQTVDPYANDASGNPAVSLNKPALTLLTAAGVPTDTLTIAGQGTYTVDRTDPANPVLAFQPLPGYSGSPTPATYRIADANGTTASSTYSPTVTPVTRPDTSTGVQGVPQTVNVLANDTLSTPGGGSFNAPSLQLRDPADGVFKDSVTVPGVGTYVANDDGTLTFTPLPGYTGTPPALTYGVNDANGSRLTDTYTPTVTAVTPKANPDSSTGAQGVPQRVNPLTNDTAGDPAVPLVPSTLTLLTPAGVATDTLTVAGQGTYTVDRTDPANPVLVFTPLSTYSGTPTPATYRVADANGTTASSTYAPRVTPVAPNAARDTSTAPQGDRQTVDPFANDTAGNATVPIVRSSLTLLTAGGTPTDTLTIPGQGTYTVDRTDPANPVLAFQPLPGYSGTPTPATYRIADTNGTTATAPYQPTVTPVTRPDTSTDIQGAVQTVNVLANDTQNTPAGGGFDATTLQLVDPADGSAKDSVTVPNVGTYTVDDAGSITFTPLPGYTGTPPALTYQVRDTDGNLLSSTYTPTVTPVTPVAVGDATTGPQGLPQRTSPLANDRPGDPRVPLVPGSLTLLDGTGTPVASLTIPGQGTYTIDRTNPANPQIVFTPLATYSGTPTPATYRIADTNGTTATATYQPNIAKVTPTGKPDFSTSTQGDLQSVDPYADNGSGADTSGNAAVPINRSSLRFVDAAGNPTADTRVVPGQGTYAIDRTDPANPRITFQPLPDYVGTPTPISYRFEDANGTLSDAVTYNPTVLPVTTPDVSSGVQGRPQTVNLLANDTINPPAGGAFNPASLQLLDPADNTLKSSVTVPNVGTYTVGTGGNVTFQPLPQYVGTPPAITYQVRDTDTATNPAGNALRSTYTPTVRAVAPTASPDSTRGPQGVVQRVNPLANDAGGDPAVPLDPDSLTLLSAAGTPVTTLTIANQGTYSVDRTNPAAPQLVFTPLPGFVGTATPADYRIADVNGTTARSAYTPTTDRVTPLARPDSTSGSQGDPQSGAPLANDAAGDPAVPFVPASLTLLNADGTPATGNVTVSGQGTYSIDRTDPANPRIVFTPLPGFTGAATPVGYRVADANGTTTSSDYTPTVTPVTKPDTTTGVQGRPQTVNLLANDTLNTPGGGGFDPATTQLIDPADGTAKDSVTVPNVGTYTVDDQGTVTFQPLPQYVGTPPALTYVVKDLAGGTLSSTYTPTVTRVTPTASPDTTSGPQGVPQRVNPLANDAPGDAQVPFDPASLTLLDAAGNPVTTLTIPNQGTYSVDRSNATTPILVFTPLRGFVGEATPANYRIADVNGTTARSTYTPTTTAVAPTAQPDATSGPQGAPQSVNPLTNDAGGDAAVGLDASSLTLLSATGDPVTSVTIPNQGTYTVDRTVPAAPKLVFTPLPGFTGKASPVDYRVADVNGTPTASTYTPTVLPVTQPDSTEGVQGRPQRINLLANDTLNPPAGPLVPASVQLIDPADGVAKDSVTLPGVGTFTVDDTGTLTFQPILTYVGVLTPPLTYVVTDGAGNKLTDVYTAAVTRVTPIAKPDTTSGPQGLPQRVNPLLGNANGGEDLPGDPQVPLDPGSLTLLTAAGDPATSVTIAGEGTYTIDRRDPDNPQIVFTPEPGFVGTATPVDYRVADVNGTTASSNYTPTTTRVTPTAAPDVTEGPQGAPQFVDPLANDDGGDPGIALNPASLRLLAADGTPTTDPVTIAGQGTYAIVQTANGPRIRFQPLPGFVGEATPVGYRVANVNGTTVDSTYTPTVLPVTTPDETNGVQGRPQSINVLANDNQNPPAGGGFNTDTLQLIDPADGVAKNTVVVPNVGTYFVNDAGIVTFQPLPQYVGTPAPITYRVDDADGNPMTSTYTPTVTRVTPKAYPDTTSGPQGIPQRVNPLVGNANGGADVAGDPLVPLVPSSLTLLDAAGDPVTELTVPGQGTYTIDFTSAGGPYIVFTPLKSFTGPATPVNYRVADANGTPAFSTYTPSFEVVTPVAKPDTSQGTQGDLQTVNPFANDTPGVNTVPLDTTSLTLLDAANNPVDELVVAGQGTFRVVNGTLTFQPEPTFTGTADAVNYRIADANGTYASSTYTPTVEPETTPDTSEDVQGVLQTKDVLANDNRTAGVILDRSTLVLIDPVTGAKVSEVVIAGQGTYRVVDGKVQFQPLPQFTGQATTVAYQVKDAKGGTLQSTYTPTVTPLKPGPNPDLSSGPQGLPQSVDPLLNDTAGDSRVPLVASTLTLLDAAGDPAESVTVDGQGTYTIDKSDPAKPKIVFTPLPAFTGEAKPVSYRVADRNGTTETSTYTPTVTPVKPTATADTSTGVQGRPQSVCPICNDAAGNAKVPLVPSSLTLLDAGGAPVDTVTVDGQGTYTIDKADPANPRIVFTPLPGFLGTATPVGYRVADANGTTVDSTYTPTLTAVRPTARPDTTKGPLNKPQSVCPICNDSAGDNAVPLDPDSLTLLDAAGNLVESVTVPGQGTYTIANGRIVFTPVTGFTGTATPVGYRIADANGTTATSTYTPTIEAAKPVVVNVKATGKPGQPVTLNPLAVDPDIDPTTIQLVGPEGQRLTTLVVPGEGTWSVNRITGAVTFTPEPGFTGDPTPVDYVAREVDGTPVTGTLTIDYPESPVEPEPPALPNTGASAGLLGAALLGLVLLGGGLGLARRRRRQL